MLFWPSLKNKKELRKDLTEGLVFVIINDITEKIMVTKIKTFLILSLLSGTLFLALPEIVGAAAPTADAGSDKEITEGELVKLNGSGTGQDLSYFWSCNGGTLINASVAQPNFTAPLVKQDTQFICNLVVSDKNGKSSTDSVSVLVKNKPSLASFKVQKTVRNISKAEPDFLKSTTAEPGEELLFQIMITAEGSEASYNIKVKDSLPPKLIYRGSLKRDGEALSENIVKEGLEIESLRAGVSTRITFLVAVADEEQFSQQTTSLINTTVAYNQENSAADGCRVTVNKETAASVSLASTGGGGVGTVSTGIGSTIFSSILFPLALALAIVLIFRSEIIGLDMVFEKRKKHVSEYRSQKRLKKLIEEFNKKS